MRRPVLRDRLEILAAAVLFSTGGVFIKATRLDAWEVAGMRALVAAIALWALMARKGPVSPPASDGGTANPGRRGLTLFPARGVLVVALAYAVTVILFVQANKRTTAANAIFLQSTSPAYVAALGHWLLGERVTRGHVLTLGLMAAGVACVLAGLPPPAATAPDPTGGNIIAAASAVTCAAMMVGLRWLGRAGGTGGAPAAVATGNVLAFLLALPFAWPIEGARPADWAIVVYLGAFQIAIAYVFLLSALRHVGALEASLLLFVEPVLSPVWAWLAHGERPGAWALVGGTLILGTAIVRSLLDAGRTADAPGPPAGGAAA